MLSERQLARRRRGLGGSEIAAIAGVECPGGRTLVDVWLCKSRGPNYEKPPIIAEPPPEADHPDSFAPYLKGDARTAGSIMEAGIADLYEFMTGAKLRRAGTRVHPEHKWALATPDRYVLDQTETDRRYERGLEIKLVGSRMTHHWDGAGEHGVPEYVQLQCQWGMYVTGLDRWDVCGLLGGSEPRIHRLERDDELIAEMVELAEDFWEKYVRGDRPPPALGGDDAMRLLRALYAQDDGEIVDVGAVPELEQLALVYEQEKAAEKAAAARAEIAKAAFCAAIGEHKGLKGPWGSAQWGTRRGSVSWKEIALELGGGMVPEPMLEAHRGEAGRSFRLYASKALKALAASGPRVELPAVAGGE